jgi:hypothetical protein
MTADDIELTSEQRQRLQALQDEMMEDNAARTLERWVADAVEYRRKCRQMGNKPSYARYVRNEEHKRRARHPKLVMVTLGKALWNMAEEVEKRG